MNDDRRHAQICSYLSAVYQQCSQARLPLKHMLLLSLLLELEIIQLALMERESVHPHHHHHHQGRTMLALLRIQADEC